MQARIRALSPFKFPVTTCNTPLPRLCYSCLSSIVINMVKPQSAAARCDRTSGFIFISPHATLHSSMGKKKSKASCFVCPQVPSLVRVSGRGWFLARQFINKHAESTSSFIFNCPRPSTFCIPSVFCLPSSSSLPMHISRGYMSPR